MPGSWPRVDAVHLCAMGKTLPEEAEEEEKQQSLFHLVREIGFPSLLTARSCSDDV